MSTSDSSERSPSKRALSSAMAAIDRILRGESAGEKPALSLAEGNLQGQLLGLIAHLDQSLLGHVDGLVVAETGGDVGELGLEEHEAEGVFEHLDLRVAPQALLLDDRLHA